MRSEVSGRVGLCLQLGWMLSASDVISNVVPAAVGINVTVGLKVRTLSFTLWQSFTGHSAKSYPFIIDCSQLG